jgi:signal peptidase I
MKGVHIVLAGVALTLCLVGLGSFMQSDTWNIHTILSQSMEPRVPMGSLVIVKAMASQNYSVNDVITFHVPPRARILVTHRIIKIQPEQPTVPVQIYTKGDANTNGDSWVLSPGNIQGKVVMTVPYLGYFAMTFRTLPGFVVLTIISFFGVVVPCITAQHRWGVQAK